MKGFKGEGGFCRVGGGLVRGNTVYIYIWMSGQDIVLLQLALHCTTKIEHIYSIFSRDISWPSLNTWLCMYLGSCTACTCSVHLACPGTDLYRLMYGCAFVISYSMIGIFISPGTNGVL